ncbi:hypothetical protein MTO96_017695 [Rhipicephalus appendiculatus]
MVILSWFQAIGGSSPWVSWHGSSLPSASPLASRPGSCSTACCRPARRGFCRTMVSLSSTTSSSAAWSTPRSRGVALYGGAARLHQHVQFRAPLGPLRRSSAPVPSSWT